MKKTRMEKGITLIALIITIVVLLILAVVAINSITNDNILGYATNASKDYNQAVQNEAEVLEEYLSFLDKYTGEKYTLTEAKTMGVINKNGNTYLVDDNGNLLILPAGLKMASDSATDNVLNGVVIENGSGDQFVWIPVGTVTKADGTTTQINLQRQSSSYNELERALLTSFMTSTQKNGGYYIARYNVTISHEDYTTRLMSVRVRK